MNPIIRPFYNLKCLVILAILFSISILSIFTICDHNEYPSDVIDFNLGRSMS